MTTPATQQAAGAAPAEIALIEKAVKHVGIKSLLNHGAGSLVYSEGVQGVTQEDLVAYTREIALHCAIALGGGGTDSGAAPAGPVAPFPGMDKPWPQEEKDRLAKVCGEIFGWPAAAPDTVPAASPMDTKMRGYMGSTPDGGIDDHDEPVEMGAPAGSTYAEMLAFGADAADTLKAIGARIGYGRAQQILGDEWDLRHGCAPRGSMGVTAKDSTTADRAARTQPVAAPLTDEQIMAALPGGILDSLADPWNEGDKNADNDSSIRTDVLRVARAVEKAHGIGQERSTS